MKPGARPGAGEAAGGWYVNEGFVMGTPAQKSQLRTARAFASLWRRIQRQETTLAVFLI